MVKTLSHIRSRSKDLFNKIPVRFVTKLSRSRRLALTAAVSTLVILASVGGVAVYRQSPLGQTILSFVPTTHTQQQASEVSNPQPAASEQPAAASQPSQKSPVKKTTATLVSTNSTVSVSTGVTGTSVSLAISSLLYGGWQPVAAPCVRDYSFSGIMTGAAGTVVTYHWDTWLADGKGDTGNQTGVIGDNGRLPLAHVFRLECPRTAEGLHSVRLRLAVTGPQSLTKDIYFDAYCADTN